ncbi:MAG: 8-oxoguanine deaminase [Thermoflexus sp.]|uniref:8-oxoguanine deaminase n=1 Tax=Thermoflexus sp. TaxID=1969742 RepID=UPI00331CC40B
MPTLLLRHADLLVTMDDERRRIPDGGLFARDGVIEQVGPTADLPASADLILEARGMVVLPGMVNTHHHLYQTLTRAIAQNAKLFDWLRTLYPIWARMDGEAVYVSALVGMAELLHSGCTTTSDHLYLFPNGARLDDEIQAAHEIGIRFHATRGAMSLGESKGGLPPDAVVEEEEAILKDMQRVIEAYHDPRPYAMVRIALAPCSPFSVTPELMREAAALARHYGVMLHTHLAETREEEAYCLARFGKRPVAFAAELGWDGPDVWFAHMVHLNAAEIDALARSGAGVAHCPSSNMRLASGVAPVRAMLDRGVKVGLGVDGSASNDASHMLAEARQAMLLQRVALERPDALTAEEALWLATRGGAAVLGRDDIGQLAPGKAADFAAWRLDRLEYAGARHDPMAALIFCQPRPADLVVVHGRVVVQEGRLLTVEEERLIERHNRIARRIVRGEP